MIPKNRDRVLSREVTVTQIPSGDRQVLPMGSRIQIHQTRFRPRHHQMILGDKKSAGPQAVAIKRSAN